MVGEVQAIQEEVHELLAYRCAPFKCVSRGQL